VLLSVLGECFEGAIMAAKKKSGNNKPGPWDDIARAAGAVKRTVISNPGNRNKASNLDKWLKGGNYQQKPISQMPGDIAHAVTAVAKGVDKVVRKVTPLPDKKTPAKTSRPTAKKQTGKK
jgi:hypothetical protein